MSAREYLIDASAYWRIDRGAVLALRGVTILRAVPGRRAGPCRVVG